MVSTTSLTPHLGFRPIEIQHSEFDAEQQYFNEVEHTLASMAEKIRPVLKYLCKPVGCGIAGEDFRGILLAKYEGEQLGLSQNGEWFLLLGAGTVLRDAMAWREFVLADVLTGINAAFQDAIEKKRQHLAALEARAQALKQMSSLITGAIVQ